MNRRVLFLCILLAFSAAALQAVPGILGNTFAFTVILGGLPVYIAARLSCTSGIAVFFTASALSAYMDISEALFFICTNGIIGLSLGLAKGRFKNIYTVPFPSALLVVVMLSAVNYLFGIRIFGNSALKSLIPQAITLLPPLYIYCFIYLKLSMFADNLLHRNIELNNH
ncbi:MAG: hypothetical protein APF77_07255 [Clostridia bacterium BRH_c25]|nr:MAG: hypothetical protein APF77_07255 [Clostridia bacterium BRH_c25]